MSLQLPWSPACLSDAIPDPQIDRTIPVRRQNWTALVAQCGTYAVNLAGVTQMGELKKIGSERRQIYNGGLGSGFQFLYRLAVFCSAIPFGGQ